MSVRNSAANSASSELLIEYFESIRDLCLNRKLDSCEDKLLAFNHSLIKTFSSNHPKRYRGILKKTESAEGIYSLKTYAENKPFILYAGDSHAEYASRLPQGFQKFTKQEVSQSCYWLGPKTLYGFLCKKKAREDLYKYLEHISHNPAKCSLILSFGEIDVRNLIYRMIVARKFRCVDEYANSLYPLMKNFVKEIEESSKSKIALYFIAPPRPCRQIKFSTPKSIEEMNLYDQKGYIFPVLGSPSTRLGFYESINDLLTCCAKDGMFKYIIRGQVGCKDGYFDTNCSHDGIHMSSQAALEQQLDIFNQISRKMLQLNKRA